MKAKKYNLGGKVDPKKKKTRVIELNGKRYELSEEESARYDKYREREWNEYKKEYGEGEEAELDFGSDFMGGKGWEYLSSGEYKNPLEESDSEYKERSWNAYKQAVQSSDNRDSLLTDDAMKGYIKKWISENPKTSYRRGGMIPKKKKY